MKKKRILGIVTAMLMVIALALTGCGQQGEQNAGATGSEGQNSTITDNGNANNGEATAEPEEPEGDIGEKPDGSDAMALMAWYYKRDKSYIETVEKDTDGYYHYAVGDKELPCKTNVWDFIETREGKRGTYYVWLFEDMAEAIGLTTADFENSRRAAAKVDPNQTRWDFILNPGTARKNIYDYTSIEVAGRSNYYEYEEMIYRVPSSAWSISLEQICFSAYEMEQLMLGRTEDEIMSSDFSEWHCGMGYIIPQK